MKKKTDGSEKPELDVDLTTGKIIPENKKREYKTPEATRAGMLKNVTRSFSGDGSDGLAG